MQRVKRPRGFPPSLPAYRSIPRQLLKVGSMHDRSSILFVDHVRPRSTDHSFSLSLSLSISVRNGFEVVRRKFKGEIYSGIVLGSPVVISFHVCMRATGSMKKSTSSLLPLLSRQFSLISNLCFEHVCSKEFAFVNRKSKRFHGSSKFRILFHDLSIPEICLTPFRKYDTESSGAEARGQCRGRKGD